jgi:hypothetical protein
MILLFPFLILAASLAISLPGKAAIVDMLMTAAQQKGTAI